MRKMMMCGLVATALAGCGKMIDHQELEQRITDKLRSRLALKSVSCPDGRPFKAGDTFECTGKTADGENLRFSVKQTDGAGKVHWDLVGVITDFEQIGKSIERDVGVSVHVKCPPKVSVVQINDSVTCAV